MDLRCLYNIPNKIQQFTHISQDLSQFEQMTLPKKCPW